VFDDDSDAVADRLEGEGTGSIDQTVPESYCRLGKPWPTKSRPRAQLSPEAVIRHLRASVPMARASARENERYQSVAESRGSGVAHLLPRGCERLAPGGSGERIQLRGGFGAALRRGLGRGTRRGFLQAVTRSLGRQPAGLRGPQASLRVPVSCCPQHDCIPSVARCPPIAPAHVPERPIASRSDLSASAPFVPQPQRPQPFLNCFSVFEGSGLPNPYRRVLRCRPMG